MQQSHSYLKNKDNLKIELNKNIDIEHFFYDASRVFSIPKSIKDYNKISNKNKNKIKDPTESLESFLISQKKNLIDNLKSHTENESTKNIELDNSISLLSKIEMDLKEILENDSTKLSFDKNSDRALIVQNNGESFFTFDSLSSGFKAIFIIYADLLMKAKIKKVNPEELNAVVIIDEIDVHLHISLQKKVLPFFTKAFPNLQFIVSTHSPFVITSTDNNTVVYDISSGELYEEDLSYYSHESIIKELFHVRDENENLKQLSNRLLQFINSENVTQDLNAIHCLLDEINKDFEKLSVELQLQYIVAKNKLAKLKHEVN